MAEIDKKALWVCGKWRRDTDDGVVWEFAGLFSTEAKAVAACRTRDYFIGPCLIDLELPEEPYEWPESYFPLRKAEDIDCNDARCTHKQ